MNRTILIFLLLIPLSFGLIGQQQTIEIEVSDTINIIPDELIYMFTTNGEEELSFGHIKEGNSITPEQLKELISHHPEIIIIEDDPSILRSDIYESLLSNTLIKSNSKRSINSLIKELVEFTNITGNVIEMIVNDTESAESNLKEKLLKLARNRALQTTQLINRDLGEIQSIVEFEFIDQSKKENEKGGGWTAYPPLSGLAHVFGTPTKVNDSKVYYQKMKITYELK